MPGESNPNVPSTGVGSALSCLLSLQSELCGQETEASGTAGNRTQPSCVTLQSWMHQVLSGAPCLRKATVQPETALAGTIRHTEGLCVPVQS